MEKEKITELKCGKVAEEEDGGRKGGRKGNKKKFFFPSRGR